MSGSHAYSSKSTSQKSVLQELEQALMTLKVRARQGQKFDSLECELHKAFMAAERGAMKALLEEYDIPSSFHSEGRTYRLACRSRRRYMTVAGEVEVERHLFRTERNGECYCPLELRTGMIEQFWTPQAAKQAIYLTALMTPEEAEGVLKEWGAMTPSKSSLDRLPKQLNRHWERHQAQFNQTLAQAHKIPEEATTLAVSLDGVLIPTRFTRVLPSDSRFAEASCGTISYFNNEGKLLSTRYLARSPEHKKRTIKSQLKQALATITQQRPDLSIVKVADGARDNWSFLDDAIPDGECVLDFYHASQHLFTAMQSIHGKPSSKVQSEYLKYRDILLNDAKGISKIINHLRYHAKKKANNKAIKTELTYFTRHRKRCRYAGLKSENKPIGSGVVEAACKTVVQMRLKRSGQHWDEEGAQAILTFRSILLSKQLDKSWELLKPFYWKEFKLPKNVVIFPKK